MSTQTCPLGVIRDDLAAAISTGNMLHPWTRQRAVETLQLIDDVINGRGRPEYWPNLTTLVGTLRTDAPDEAGRALGRYLEQALSDHGEVFKSHIETHSCPSGDCARLTPAPCQMSCPAGIDIPSYLTLIGQGLDTAAVELIRKDNPFPWVCGLICTNPCEMMCVRARIDSAVAIKTLKGFAAERAMSQGRYGHPPRAADSGRRVCVIGAGPAGLTAAYYLTLKGHRVTIIDGLPMAGGMMMVGIPRYRLPREVIDREVALIDDLGVEFRFETYLGQDVTIDSLKDEGFEAFLISMGAHSCMSMRIPGERDFDNIIGAIDVLRNVALGDYHLPGKKIAVIGGGNVAIDAARTCLRLGAEEVTLVYRRTKAEMPANPEEVEQAEDEGIKFLFLTVPSAIVGQKRKLAGLICLRTELGPQDQSGRQSPVIVKGSDFRLDVDVVVSAIGQVVHPGGLTSIKDLKWSRRGTIVVNTANMATSVPGIFAAGDIVTGPATVVEAIGGGKKAAEAIDRFLSGLPLPGMPLPPVRRARLDCLEVDASTKMTLQRPHQGLLNLDRRRITFQQVELGLTEKEARDEARRCLRCDICRRCGACVAICRDQMGIDALKLGYLDFDQPTPTDLTAIADKCITCGACTNICPTGAIHMEDKINERVLTLCGTILNSLDLETCVECGAALGPGRYRDHIRQRIGRIPLAVNGQALCHDCARRHGALSQTAILPPDCRRPTRTD
ncbi:MAG: FAD-dependent oxidoreductase [Deltaproteobacteria bacterium]|nr:FAD-dependent oxidoreductase [Deltaproteobacteria bacterium]